MKTYRAGIDIRSTTVKLVLLDEDGKLLFGDYRRHHAHTQETLRSLLMQVRQTLGNCHLRLSITGSGSINLGKALNIPFVQEVVAVATAIKSNTICGTSSCPTRTRTRYCRIGYIMSRKW